MTDAARPPFAADDLVYLPDHPETGAMRVTICLAEDDGEWRVTAQADGAEGIAPWVISADAGDFRPLPAGWTDPPLPPALTECVAATALSFNLWRERKAAWLAWLDKATQPVEPTNG